MIDNQVISTEVGGDFGSLRDELRTNIPPELKVDGDKRRTIKAGMPLTLTAFAKDPDNIPARRGKARRRRRRSRPPPCIARPRLWCRPAGGLRLSWIVYRGHASDVTFSPEQMKAWTDTRAARTRRGRRRSFRSRRPTTSGSRRRRSEPGTYVLRAVASDGACSPMTM
jgi:hypothetical protein